MKDVGHVKRAVATPSPRATSTPDTEPVESQMLPGLGYGFTVIARAINRRLHTLFKRPTPSH